ncbi:MAG: methyltransferase domain-containing protein [Candidatus Aminicenantales bacterium]
MRKPGRSKIAVAEFYEIFDEDRRLLFGLGRLEFERVKAVVGRFLPPPPAIVLDVGGGTGPYSSWLAKLGYEVHLVEPSAKLIAIAQRRAEKVGKSPLFRCFQGDARSLEFPDRQADAVLLFGPPYHLTEERDRLRALAEARRVLKKRGLLFCAAISRFASAVDGLSREFIKDPVFERIIDRDLTDGQHRNPTGRPDYFTDAYFHEPSRLKNEIESAGFASCRVLAVEGLGVMLRDIDVFWKKKRLRAKILSLIERTESEPSILGVSPHLLAVARKAR